MFTLSTEWPECFACARHAPADENATPRQRWNGASRYLDRAHLVNRSDDGLDGPQNVVALCKLCHRGMPPFRGYDEYPDPITWVQRGGWLFEFTHWAPSGMPYLAPRDLTNGNDSRAADWDPERLYA